MGGTLTVKSGSIHFALKPLLHVAFCLACARFYPSTDENGSVEGFARG